MLADTRTNAGVDHISTFGKLFVFETPGERLFAVMTAGNLAVTQAVINLLGEGMEGRESGSVETMLEMPTMFRAAQFVGRAIRSIYEVDGKALQEQHIPFDASFILGGQIAGRTMRMFHVYAAGNFIEATTETPFLQVGEHKYGRPILDRAVAFDTPLEDGIKLALISMDSTLRSNLTVGLPLDLLVVRRDTARVALQRRIGEDDDYFKMIRERWSEALREAHRGIPTPDWPLDG